MNLVRTGSSEMLLEEFFAKMGLESVWADFRFNILGPIKPFFLMIGATILLFLIASKAGSKSLQILSALAFLILVSLKVMTL